MARSLSAKWARHASGGLHLPQAAEAIATVFRLAGRNTREITVQIISVENTPVLSLNGDVMEAEFIPVFKAMSVKQAVTVTGGRKTGSTTRGVYISRQAGGTSSPRWKQRTKLEAAGWRHHHAFSRHLNFAPCSNTPAAAPPLRKAPRVPSFRPPPSSASGPGCCS